MARHKIPDHLMTPEQLRQRERNERYRQKLLQKNVVSINKIAEQRTGGVAAISQPPASQTQTPVKEEKHRKNEWKRFEVAYTNPAICLTSLSVLAITSLLVVFQATAYLNEGMGAIAWFIAAICELSLIALTILYSGMRSKIAGVLFIGLFAYCLGVMSFDLKQAEAVAVESSQFSSKSFKSLDKSLSQAQRSLDLALKRGESGNVAKHTKTVENLVKMMSEAKIQPDKISLISNKTSGLIGLRAILMLLSALLVHFVIIFVRKA